VTSTSPTSIAALPRGHELAPATFTLTRTGVDAYLRAVGDQTNYGDAVPPLALVALALAALQSQVWLPEGSLHTGQEVEHERDARAGEQLTLNGRIAQRSERQGYVISVIELEVAGADGVAVRARTTIMAPGGGA
jgi:hypothetical protein